MPACHELPPLDLRQQVKATGRGSPRSITWGFIEKEGSMAIQKKGKVKSDAGGKAEKRGGKKTGLKLKDLDAKNARKVRGGMKAKMSDYL